MAFPVGQQTDGRESSFILTAWILITKFFKVNVIKTFLSPEA